MKHFIQIILTAVVIVCGPLDAMAIEEAVYKVLKKENHFEIRDYAPHILAETVVEGGLEEAGYKAFNRLFRYISGDNRSRDKVAMTSPVSQEPTGQKIQMTAPVGQQRDQENWAVSFIMPASYTLESLPEPVDPKVKLPAHRAGLPGKECPFFDAPLNPANKAGLADALPVTLRPVPARRMAAVRYSGFWSEKNYLRYKRELESWTYEKGLTIAGDPIWARYNPPFTPWFMRRNEILIPVYTGAD